MGELIKKHNKSLKIILLILAIILSIIYLRFFSQHGIIYDDTFLIKKQTSQGISFQGKSKSGPINLKVKGNYLKEENVVLEYELPNNINKKYLVEFGVEEENYSYKVKISDGKGDTIFNGFYLKNTDFVYLLDESKEIVFPDPDIVFYNSGNESKTLYDSSYEISPYNIMNLATQKNVDVRGKYPPFFSALLLLVITIIDIKYPLFLFHLDTWLNVEDAKPSEFYLTMQRISWYAFPTIALILLVAAVT